MTLSWFDLLAILGAPLLLGISLLRVFGIQANTDRVAWLGWSYGLGMLITAVIALVSPVNILIPVLVLCALLLAFRRHQVTPTALPTAAKWQNAVFFVALFTALGITGLRVHSPAKEFVVVSKSDDAYIWALKAKLLFEAEGLNERFADLAAQQVRPTEWARLYDKLANNVGLPGQAHGTGRYHLLSAHLDYPLFNPLLQLTVFQQAGRILHWENRLPIQGFLFALILVLAAAARRVGGPLLGAAAVILFVTMGRTAWIAQTGYADPMVAFGMLVAADSWLRFRKSQDGAFWLLSCFGLAIAIFSKHEGSLYAGLWLASLLLQGLRSKTQRPWRHFWPQMAWLALPAAVVALGATINAVFGFAHDMMTAESSNMSPLQILASEGAARFSTVVSFLWTWVWCAASFHFLPLAFVALALLAFRKVFTGRTAVLATFLSFALAVHIVVYLATHLPLEQHLWTSARRVSWQVWPVGILVIAAVVRDLLDDAVSPD